MHKKFRIRFGFSLSDNRKSKTCTEPRRSIQNRKWGGIVAIGVTFALCGAVAEAQQPKKIPRIGYLTGVSLSADSPRVEGFRQGLRKLGYVEGKNIIIEYRYADGKFDRLPALAAELVRLKVDVIVTAGATNTRAAKEATNTIPIVMAQDPDPVGSGFVASLARPGGNITGLSSLTADLSGKRLELLKEILPKLSRLAVLGTSASPGMAQQLRETELAAGAFGMQFQFLDILDPKDIEAEFRAATKWRADAVLVLRGPVLTSQRTQVVELAVKSRLPATYPETEYVEAGGLMSYGVSNIDLFRRAATYVDKILKGAKPADLPVEQPTKFELEINLKAAKQIGLTIPPNVLARADKVIR
ncbi:MAG: ABC transporter substrate-binding protein [Deltaproteobacteria bacterium]|nr:ABC transporter substrate-binding protein [Deltaproteobacteria bacterium]